MTERQINLKLKIKLLERNMSQKELARLAGVPEQMVSMIARGLYIPNIAQMTRIAQVLEIDPNKLFR